MTETMTRCLILACGNTLRSDDGVGPWLAAWAQDRFRSDAGIRVIARHQWTPDLAAEIAVSASILFIDCSIASAPGSLAITEVQPSAPGQGVATHHVSAPQLLALCRDLYDALPRNAALLTIGAGSTKFGEDFSPEVTASVAAACALIEATVARLSGCPEARDALRR